MFFHPADKTTKTVSPKGTGPPSEVCIIMISRYPLAEARFGHPIIYFLKDLYIYFRERENEQGDMLLEESA